MAYPGGAPANVAVGVARLGGKSGFLGAIGNDAFGKWLTGLLMHEGVDCRHCPTYDRPTSLAFVTLDSDGERHFAFYRNKTSDTALRATDIDPTVVDHSKAVHICSVSLSVDPSREATQSVIERAYRSGKFVSFDVDFRPALWADLGSAYDVIRRVIRKSDLVKLNADELLFLEPTGDLRRLVADLDPNRRKLWVVTRGRSATVYICGSHEGEVDSFPVHATDTTGAGDAFVAALLVQLAKTDFRPQSHQELEAALSFANAAAAQCVQRHGAIPALPNLEQVEHFLREHDTRATREG